jgi:hypothetical protein
MKFQTLGNIHKDLTRQCAQWKQLRNANISV